MACSAEPRFKTWDVNFEAFACNRSYSSSGSVLLARQATAAPIFVSDQV